MPKYSEDSRVVERIGYFRFISVNQKEHHLLYIFLGVRLDLTMKEDRLQSVMYMIISLIFSPQHIIAHVKHHLSSCDSN